MQWRTDSAAGKAISLLVAAVGTLAQDARTLQSEENQDSNESTLQDIQDITKDVMRIGFVTVMLIILYIFKGTWYPEVYRRTLGSWNLPRLRSWTPIGWWCSVCCGCWVPKYHPSFRLRIVIHKGTKLRNTEYAEAMKCYVNVKCGLNPVKTTSMQTVPTDNVRYPVVWEDAVDLEVDTADDSIDIQAMEFNYIAAHTVIGHTELSVAEIYYNLRGSLGEPAYRKHVEMRLLYLGSDAGSLFISLYATYPGDPLPPLTPGILDSHGARHSQETRHLMSGR